MKHFFLFLALASAVFLIQAVLYSPNPVNTASYKMKLIVEECVDSRKCYRSRAEIRRGKVEDMIALKWGETDDLLPMNPEGAEVDVS